MKSETQQRNDTKAVRPAELRRRRAQSAESLLTQDDVRDFLNLASTSTLEKWRRAGKGPRFIRLGEGSRSAIRYRLADLEDWIASRSSAPSH